MSLRPGTKVVSYDGIFAFEIGDCLGSGKQGTVYEVKANNIGLNDIVIKIIGGKQISSQILNHIEQLLTPEIKKMLCQIPSLKCVLVTPFISYDDKCCLLMPRAKGLVLETDDAWGEISQLSMNQKYELAHQIVHGIEVIHQAGRIHADIAGPNIIIDKDQLRTYIVDIDGGGVINSIPAIVAGHPMWMAPELEKTQNPDDVTLETDRWSLAILVHYLIIGCHPFHFCSDVKDYSNYEQNWPPNPHDFDDDVVKKWLLWQQRVLKQIGDLAELFKRCFGPGQSNPKIRPTATEWKRHLSRLAGNKTVHMELCPKCGYANKNELVYCENCVSILHQALIRCSRCGSYIAVNASFCPRCSAKV
jgi:serine/threonine protein kinase